MTEPIEFSVEETDEGKRIDSFLSESGIVTRSGAVRLLESGAVLLNDIAVSEKKKAVRSGDIVTVFLPDPEPSEILPEKIPLDIVYEDDDLLVVNKQKGMVVHPAPGNYSGTLVNALLFHCGASLSGIGGVIRPGIVHRIDKDTSGLLVVAKNDKTHLALSEQLKGHHIDRIYTAICVGNIRESGTVNQCIGRHPIDRKKMAVYPVESPNAREAITHYEVLKNGVGEGNAFTYVKCRLETGRTHQIRVHLSSIGHPIMGDTLYGGGRTNFEKHHANLLQEQCLHAGELHFIHPGTNQPMSFTAEEPPEMLRLISILFS